MGDFEKRISAMYNAPIWALHRLIFDLWLEVLSLRRKVAAAAKAGEKAA